MMDSECAELQRAEMEALMAIYTSESFAFSTNENNIISGSIDAEVDADVCRQFIDAAHSNQSAGSMDWRRVKYLPPIRLDFTLPAAYPMAAAPQVSLSCCWLGDRALDAVMQGVLDIWSAEQGMCVLNSYIDHLRHDLQPSSILQISLGDDSGAAEGHMRSIVAYGNAKHKQYFESRAYTCLICMEEQTGRHCMELSCTHVFCRQCLSDYLRVLVTDGNILQMICPHLDCRKLDEPTIIGDSELDELLTNEQLTRIRGLREQRLLELNPMNYAKCPRTGCGKMVECDRKIERLCICQCGFTFCRICLRAWHGTNPCFSTASNEILEQYKRALVTEDKWGDSTDRKDLEARYGAKRLKQLLRQGIEELMSLDLIRSTTMCCPKCQMAIKKSYGCNHMQCSRCSTHFCYLCGSRIDQTEPMSHFNSRNSRCSQKLFDGIEATDNDTSAAQEAEQDEANLFIRLAFG